MRDLKAKQVFASQLTENPYTNLHYKGMNILQS